MQSITNNAIAWAALQLQGGWKNVLLTAVAYSALMAVGAVTLAQFATIPPSAMMFRLLVVLLAIQAAWLLLFAPSRIQAALRRDVASGMIESHRLMPLPPVRAVVGYLIGPTVQPMGLALATFIVGAFVASVAAVSLPRWMIANFLLVELAAVAWVIMSAAALNNAQGAFIVLTFLLPTVIGNSAVHVLPGAVLLVPPVIEKTVFQLPDALGRAHVAGFLLHGAIIAIFLRAAARKYVRADLPAFTPVMGLALIGCWAVASIVAMRWWDEVQPAMFQGSIRGIDGATVMFSTIAGGLLALPSITLSVRPSPQRRNTKRFTPIAMPLAVIVGATALAMLPAVCAAGDLWRLPRVQALAYTALPLLTLCVSASLLARSSYLHGLNAWGPIAVWIALTALGPIAYDMARHTLLGDGSDFQLGSFSDLSPIGMIHAVWRRGAIPATSAVVAHVGYVVIAGIILFVSYAFWQRRHLRAGNLPTSS